MVAAAGRPESRVLRGLARIWRPRPNLSRSQWCHENLRLPDEWFADPKFDLDKYPFWRGVLDQADDPETRTITVMAGTQVGKTTCGLSLLSSEAELNPCPAMFASPDRDKAIEERTKLYRIAQETACLRERVPPKRLWNDRWVDLGSMLAHLAWSGNTQRLSGKACRLVVCTELDRWRHAKREGNTADLAAQRVKAFYRSLIYYEGTPTDEESAIDLLYQLSDRRRYHVPCPHCGVYQELRFFLIREGPHAGCGGVAGLEDKAGNLLSIDDIREQAYYRCLEGCRVDNAEKPQMLARGVWCPAGQKVDRDGTLAGTPEQSARDAGFQLSSLYSPVLSFGDFAAEWALARESTDKLQVWWNNWLGLKYRLQTKMPSWKALGKRLSAAHPRGKAPQPALFLTAGVDVQLDYVKFVVRAWGEASTSWLVDFGRVNQRVGPDGRLVADSDLAQLEEILYRGCFPLTAANPVGTTELAIRLIAIDVNYRSLAVHNWARAHHGDRVRCVAGDPKSIDLFKQQIITKSARDGKPYPGGLVRWALNTPAFKEDIQGRWNYEQGRPGEWLCFARAVELAETYLREVVNEAPFMARDERGRKVKTWKERDSRTRHDYWDGEVYARAAAEMVTGGDWEGLAERFASAQAPTYRTEPESRQKGWIRPLHIRRRSR